MDDPRELLGIRRMDRVLDELIRELCGVNKGPDEMTDEGVLRWFGYVKRMERDRIAKGLYVGKCVIVVV